MKRTAGFQKALEANIESDPIATGGGGGESDRGVRRGHKKETIRNERLIG